MTLEMILVVSILIVAFILLITEWVRLDLVALIVLCSLSVTSLVSRILIVC